MFQTCTSSKYKTKEKTIERKKLHRRCCGVNDNCMVKIIFMDNVFLYKNIKLEENSLINPIFSLNL